VATGNLPPDAKALWAEYRFPRLDCGDIPQSDERLVRRREKFGDPQRVVSAAVKQTDCLVIVRHRSDSPDWTLPGGRVEPEESFEAAAVREAKEECGLDVAILEPLAIVTARLVAPVDSMQWLDVLFAARATGGTLGTLDVEEVDETRWVSIDELEDLYARGRVALSWLSFGRSAAVPAVDAQLLSLLREFTGRGSGDGIGSSPNVPSG